MAELSSQQALPDMSSTETKLQVKDEEDDSNFAKKQLDIKMEVCSQFYNIILLSLGKKSIAEEGDGKNRSYVYHKEDQKPASSHL